MGYRRRRRRACALRAAFAAVMSVAATGGAAVTVAPRGPVAGVKTFDRVAWRVDTGRTYRNPFDPDEVAVDARFTGPGGRAIDVPGFWRGEDGFEVRFAPPAPGAWTMVVSARGGDRTVAQAEPVRFDVEPGTSPGFVRRATANAHYLRFDSGRSYFPVGMNVCWAPGSGSSAAEWYDATFAKLAANGGNFARVWMGHPPVMIETAAGGAGKYGEPNGEFFDAVLDSAGRHGIGVMLCFMNHRELLDKDMWGPAGWPESAYNTKNGGPATRPVDFFTNEAAKKQFKARLRYLVARYSAYTSVAFWELFNEQELSRVPIPVAWNAEMAAFIRRIDPYAHLITTSADVPDAVWELPESDLTQAHVYGDGAQVDTLAPVAASAARYARFNKPHLVGEAGIDYHGPDAKFDPDGRGTTFHNALWAGALSGGAGTAMYWWWDNYVGPKNLWHEFKAVAAFTRGVDWANRDFRPVPVTHLCRRSTNSDAFADLVLLPAGGWGDVAPREPVVVPPNGRPAMPLPRYLCGPNHKELHAPIVLTVDLPKPSVLSLGINQASDFAAVRVWVDGKPTIDLPFSALPGAPDVESTKFSDEHGIYCADVNKERTVPGTLAAGRHVVKIDAIAGDWVTLSAVRFTNALDPRYANLDAVAVQDVKTRETLAWVWDTRSNWKDDQSPGTRATSQDDVEVVVSNVSTGTWTAEWWDTRGGSILRTDTVAATGGRLVLAVPRFTRDVAVRVRPKE